MTDNTKEQEVITLIGLPASGKTTFALQWVEEDPRNRIRINRDDLRNMAGVYWVPQREDLITQWEEDLFLAALERGYSIIVDATNFRDSGRWQKLMFGYLMHAPAHPKPLRHTFKYLYTSLEECIERDSKRTEGHVGRDVIMNMYKKYVKDGSIPISETSRILNEELNEI